MGEVIRVYGDRMTLRNIETKTVFASLRDSCFDLVEQIDKEELKKLL